MMPGSKAGGFKRFAGRAGEPAGKFHVKNGEGFRFYVELLRPQRKLLLFAAIFAALKALLEAPVPRISGWLLDRFAKEDTAWFGRHWIEIVAALAAFLLIYLPVCYGRGYCPNLVAFRAFFSLRMRLFNHLQNLSADFFARNRIGDLTARLITDIQIASTVAVNVITRVAFDIFIFVPALYFSFRLSWPLTLLVLGYGALQLFFIQRYLPEIQRRNRAIQEKMGEISSEATEKLAGMELIRSLAKEKDVVQRFEDLNARHLYLNASLQRWWNKRSAVIHGPDECLAIVLILLAAPFVARSRLSAGDVVAVILYAPIMIGPLFRFADAMTQWAQAMGAISRVIEVLATVPTVNDKPKAVELPRSPGQIEFDHVDFAYPSIITEGEPAPVIHDLTLNIQPGTVVAFVGPSGSGKTTLIQLLLRFYDVDRGAIRVNGQDLRDVTQSSIRRTIGVVMQQSVIFSGTIRDNLRFVKPEAGDEELKAALRQAQLLDFVEDLPEGLNMLIGEHGVNLSGGQKQRLAIARTFLKNPAILVLDEATSALDARSEAAIQEAVDQLMVGRTTLVIAHRLSTVRNADQIVVIDQGQIVEQGTHADLMDRHGTYFNLVRTQTEQLI